MFGANLQEGTRLGSTYGNPTEMVFFIISNPTEMNQLQSGQLLPVKFGSNPCSVDESDRQIKTWYSTLFFICTDGL